MNTNYQPVQPQERLEILDLLRGFALFGIFMVNLPLMNAPFVTEMGKFTLWPDPANETAEWFIRFFFTGKFYTLFSMLFGMGFYFFLKKADESGNNILPLFRRRLGWLLAIGIMHVVLMWYGDILVFYALFGFLMILFRKKSPRALVIWAVCILLIPVTITLALVLLFDFLLSQPEMNEGILDGFAQAAADMELFMARAVEVYSTGSFLEIVKIRLEEYSNILGGIVFFFPNVLAMFLVGLALAKKKVFENLEASKGFFVRLLLFSLPVAIAGNWLMAHYGAKSSYVYIDWAMFWQIAGMAFGGPALTFVYISILAHCYHKGYLGKLAEAIKKTGRMALTNYLMQSFIATTIFFSYGFGLYGQVNIWQGMLMVTGIYILQVGFSTIWLSHYRYGPMEWLWRSLTYWKKQKMKL